MHHAEHEHHGHSHGGLDDLHTIFDMSPVHEAAREGELGELQQIIANDPAKAVECDKYGLTPLHWACDRGQEEIVKFLLLHQTEHGTRFECDVNAVEKRLFRRQPIHFAALQGSVAVMKRLLEHGANAGATDYKGWNALHCAAYGGFVDLCALLLDAGMPLSSTTKRNETALHLAARQEHAHVIELLLARCKLAREIIEMRDHDGLSAVEIAAPTCSIRWGI